MEKKQVKNIGIHGIEVYFPRYYVAQEDLEVHDKVGKGKYTIGLGQKTTAMISDREDVTSLSLTSLKNLLEKYNIKKEDVGRLEVGTETLLDKSKAIKTSLMELFQGCHDIEGVQSTNACYGATAAIFNTIDWV